jgi:hypothetical protein
MKQALCKFDDNWTSSASLSSLSTSSSPSLSSSYNVTQLPLATTSHTPKEIQQFIKVWTDHYSDVSLLNDICMPRSVWKQCENRSAWPIVLVSLWPQTMRYSVVVPELGKPRGFLLLRNLEIQPGKFIRQRGLNSSWHWNCASSRVTKTLGFGWGQELCTQTVVSQ